MNIAKGIEMNNWKNVKNELPPCDGIYECQMDDNHINWTASLFYDGFGFKIEHAYRDIRFWREAMPLKKKYGRVDEEKDTFS